MFVNLAEMKSSQISCCEEIMRLEGIQHLVLGTLLLEAFLPVLPPLLGGCLFLMFLLELQWVTFVTCWTNHLSLSSGCIGQLDLPPSHLWTSCYHALWLTPLALL